MENRLKFLYRSAGVQDAKGLRRSERPAHDRKCGSKPVGGSRRQIRGVTAPRGDGESESSQTGPNHAAEKHLYASQRAVRTVNRHR